MVSHYPGRPDQGDQLLTELGGIGTFGQQRTLDPKWCGRRESGSTPPHHRRSRHVLLSQRQLCRRRSHGGCRRDRTGRGEEYAAPAPRRHPDLLRAASVRRGRAMGHVDRWHGRVLAGTGDVLVPSHRAGGLAHLGTASDSRGGRQAGTPPADVDPAHPRHLSRAWRSPTRSRPSQ